MNDEAYSLTVFCLLIIAADLEQMVFMDVRKRELLEARFVNEKVCLLFLLCNVAGCDVEMWSAVINQSIIV